MNKEKYADKINAYAKKFNNKLDSKLDDLRNIENALKKSNFNYPIKIEISSDTDNTVGKKYLSWEPSSICK